MRIMLSVGPSSERVKELVSKSADNADVLTYEGVEQLIADSKLRRFTFSRLIFSSKFINSDADMSKLCDFVKEYTERSEIVYLLNLYNKDLEGVFKRYFNSPLYTVIYTESAVARVFTDSVVLSIKELKEKYPHPDLKDTNKSGKAQIDLATEQNSLKSPEAIENAEEQNSSFGFANIGGIGVDSGVIEHDEKSAFSGTDENSDISNDGSSSQVGFQNISENSVGDDLDLDLSIGNFGSQHTDTGFVDSDDEDELKDFADNIANEVSKSARTTSTVGIAKKGYSIEGVLAPGKVNIVTGVRGSGSAPYIINTAVSAQKAGKRVLVVDMDTATNGVLSYLDTKDFYAKGCSRGIEFKRVYRQAGIDFVSNGFNTGDIRGVDDLLGGSVLSHYDVVLVDCPCESLKYISDRNLGMCNVVICCGNGVDKLRETSEALCNRLYVSLFKEAYIAQSGKSANKGIADEDINMIKEAMLFPNGCWLDTIRN